MNVTLIVHVPAAASVAGLTGQLLVCPYCALTAMLVIVSAALPVLVSVTDCGPLVVLIVWLTNVKPVGDNNTAGAGAPAPVPVKPIACGLPDALSVIVTEPVWVPVAVGVKETLMVQVPAAASVAGLAGQLLVCPY